MDPFTMVVVIVFMSLTAGSVQKYLEMKMTLARKQGTGGDQSTAREIQALRQEIAALKQHESETILSFDSTLQTLDTRLKTLEQRALGAGPREPAAVRLAASVAMEESASVAGRR